MAAGLWSFATTRQTIGNDLVREADAEVGMLKYPGRGRAHPPDRGVARPLVHHAGADAQADQVVRGP